MAKTKKEKNKGAFASVAKQASKADAEAAAKLTAESKAWDAEQKQRFDSIADTFYAVSVLGGKHVDKLEAVGKTAPNLWIGSYQKFHAMAIFNEAENHTVMTYFKNKKLRNDIVSALCRVRVEAGQ